MESLSLLRRLFWVTLLCPLDFGVSDEDCTGPKPVIDPPHLVVQYGDPAEATCSAPQHVNEIGWEATVGPKTKPGAQQLVWNVSSVTDWSLNRGVQCFTSSDDKQCITHLPITIYKNPDRVTARLIYHSGPLVEGEQYGLECKVQSVAPVSNLTVTWFRGDQEVEQQSDYTQFSIEGVQSKDVTVRTNLTIRASREDHEASYSCAAKLDLNTAEPIPDTRSKITQLEVLYKPRLFNTSGNVTIDAGGKLKLTCSAKANPRPSYQWKRDGVPLAKQDSDTLLIDPVTEASGGVYECTITNTQGQDSGQMTVKVQAKGECLALHHITSHHITLHHITLHYITSHYITLHHTLHYIT
ncbi:hypothetical protein ACEWY4_017569 [Coilia grayii]|uniref:Ig-like domain-containing protein n=1 Tax=Coilia grayii TaxID=363190 RepID=A0ABD1JH76_9TELE